MSAVPKVEVNLEGVPETLLIPLVARARARSLWPDLGFADPEAEDIVRRLDFEPGRFSWDLVTMRVVAARAQIIDRLARAFFERHPDGLAVSLGAGLDTRCSRVDNGRLEWIDLDLPEVTELKRRVVPEHPRARLIAGSITDEGWLSQLGRADGRPLLVIVEGLLMYLSASDVRTFFTRVAERLPGAELLFDFVPRPMVHLQALTSVGQTSAEFAWGVRSAKTVAAWHPRFEVVGEYDLFSQGALPFRALGRLSRVPLLGGTWYSVAHLRVLGA